MKENALTPFAFDDALVRVHTDDKGNPWFVAKDVCRVLEIVDHHQAVERLDDDERGRCLISTTISNQHGDYGTQMKEAVTVSESGLYTLMLRRRDAVNPGTPAHRFRKWVTGEVLPAIRKTGGYTMPGRGVSLNARPEMPALTEEALALRPSMRQKLWENALQTARLDNAGAETAVVWFAHLCHMMVQRPDSVFEEVRSFLNECCLQAPGRSEKASVLYEAFRRWRRGRPTPMPSLKVFGQNMGLLARSRKSSNMIYCNVVLRETRKGDPA